MTVTVGYDICLFGPAAESVHSRHCVWQMNSSTLWEDNPHLRSLWFWFPLNMIFVESPYVLHHMFQC